LRELRRECLYLDLKVKELLSLVSCEGWFGIGLEKKLLGEHERGIVE
jgi:hypothetical protein